MNLKQKGARKIIPRVHQSIYWKWFGNICVCYGLVETSHNKYYTMYIHVFSHEVLYNNVCNEHVDKTRDRLNKMNSSL